MYAVIEIAGKQYRIAPKDTINIPVVKEAIGSKVTFDRILLVGEEKGVTVGHPLIPGVTVEATVMKQGREEKVIVFKKKRRKGYRVTRGHRQGFSTVEITGIG